MTYNLNVTGQGFVPFMQTANAIVDGWLGIGMMLALFIVTFYIAKGYTTRRAMMASLYFCMMEAGMLWYFKLINSQWLFGSFSMLILALIWYYVQDD